MNKLKFAIIGYGNIGKRHAQHIIQHEDAILKAVCEVPLFEKPVDFPKHVSFYDNIRKMIESEEIDIVNVCTPNYLHHPHTLYALQHQKHVVCEKPMALSSNQCNEMIDCAKENDRKIFVVKQNRYNETVQQVKKLIHNNLLGKIYMININCFWNRNEYYYHESEWRGKRKEDGGCLYTQFSHFVDILYYLFGDIEHCKGIIKNFNHSYIEIEDTGSFFMQTLSGAIVNFNFTTCSHEKNMEGAFTIIAENGTVKIGGQYLNTIEYQHIKNYILPEINIQSKSNDYGQYQGSMSNHDKMIDNVIKTLQGKETIMTNAYEGKTVVKMIEKMYAGCMTI
jgi:UDP-N-acetyl-2-amino-2-deoxyglucuronate dehydrogenase